jgi:hypothetical protein
MKLNPSLAKALFLSQVEDKTYIRNAHTKNSFIFPRHIFRSKH